MAVGFEFESKLLTTRVHLQNNSECHRNHNMLNSHSYLSKDI